MTRAALRARNQPARWAPPGVLAGAFLFNLGQGVLRPTLPLYLRTVFAANYRMVTLIPVVFGAGKWAANLPTGYLLDRLGRRRLMVGGLILIAMSDLASAVASTYGLFLVLRALAGVGWAAFSTVATTMMVDYAALLGSVPFLSHPLLLGLWSVALGSAAGFIAPLPTALIGDRAPPALQPVAIGWLRTMTDTGQILGPLAMGALADAVDLSSPFYLGATLLILTASWCWGYARAMSDAGVSESAS
jgi:MFS family permease